jgi:UPF0755 protein
MYKENHRFWNRNDRIEKAQKINLNPIDVIILASIISEESNYEPDYKVIAGVYLNRIKRNMPLQADPTIKFALGDFSIRRILFKQLNIDSPYNTYKNTGLPPGPISIPSIKAIDAVLNYDKHSYLYFCASYDFSGKHIFAKNLQQHNHNARLYQQSLNKMKIVK